MKKRTLIAFALVLLLPFCVLGLYSYRIIAAEQRAVQEQLVASLGNELSGLAAALGQVLTARTAELARLTNLPRLDAEALRGLAERERLVRQTLALDPSGRLVHPPRDDNASAAERAFVLRTERLWSGRSQLTDAADSDHAAPGTKGTANATSGWYTWYWEEGLHLLYWHKLQSGVTVGAEVDRVALLADIVAALPASDGERPSDASRRYRLSAPSGEVVYEWGNYEPSAGDPPVATASLPAPLTTYRLECRMSQAALAAPFGRSQALAVGLVLLALLLAVGGLGAYVVRETRRDLREAARRVTFVNQVSHELRTPLTSIRLYAELLEDLVDEDDAQARRYLAVIVAESQRLSRMISNVLTLAREQRGTLKLVLQTTTLAEQLGRIAAQWRPVLAERGVSLTLESTASAALCLDPDALDQILGNLLGNIEKYASAGGVAHLHADMAGERTTIRVADRGPGVPPKDRERVFAPFVRLGHGVNEGTSGTGIGLSIARGLARLHGGDLVLEPSDCGAHFVLTLHTPRPPRADDRRDPS